MVQYIAAYSSCRRATQTVRKLTLSVDMFDISSHLRSNPEMVLEEKMPLLTTTDTRNFHFETSEEKSLDLSVSNLSDFHRRLVEFSAMVGGFLLSALMNEIKPLLMTSV